MRVCLICVEIFAWGKYGGFGRATRIIGRELAKRGVEVTAIIPMREDQKTIEYLHGIRILGFPPNDLSKLMDLASEADADIYHSQEPSLISYAAMRSMPDRKHIVTFRDPRTLKDWLTEFKLPSLNRYQVVTNWIFEDNFLVHRAVRSCDATFAAAKCLVGISRKKYGLDYDPGFLPTPVDVPGSISKASTPTICFISRMDRRKRPEIFFELASSFPEYKFIAVGKSRDKNHDLELHRRFGSLPNLEMPGFLDQFSNNDLSHVLSRSWVMVNTSAREGLPNTFLEAAAHGCAILSGVDPDGFASNFGYYARLGDFGQGLESLIRNDSWKNLASKGQNYINEVFLLERSIDTHLDAYSKILG